VFGGVLIRYSELGCRQEFSIQAAWGGRSDPRYAHQQFYPADLSRSPAKRLVAGYCCRKFETCYSAPTQESVDEATTYEPARDNFIRQLRDKLGWGAGDITLGLIGEDHPSRKRWSFARRGRDTCSGAAVRVRRA
jgi:hypothetical protein